MASLTDLILSGKKKVMMYFNCIIFGDYICCSGVGG